MDNCALSVSTAYFSKNLIICDRFASEYKLVNLSPCNVRDAADASTQHSTLADRPLMTPTTIQPIGLTRKVCAFVNGGLNSSQLPIPQDLALRKSRSQQQQLMVTFPTGAAAGPLFGR